MKRTGEGVHQNNGIKHTIEFIRQNALAREIGNQPVITSRGERFLSELSSTVTRPNSGLGVL